MKCRRNDPAAASIVPLRLNAQDLPFGLTEAALVGAHVATMPLKVLEQMSKHPLTDKGIAVFKADWAKAKGGK